MRAGARRMMILAAAAMAVAWLIGGALTASETTMQAPQQKPQMVEEVFKNIQALKGITVDDFIGTMGVMSAALGFCCSDCHSNAGTDKVAWEADTVRKQIARRMVTMVANINRDNFGGRQTVTCWTCHRGRDRPMVTPALDYVYGTPNTDRDDVLTQAPGMPTPDQVLDKYIQAIGGAQRVAGITGYTARGTSVGFGGLGGGAQVEIYAKAPDQRAVYIHFADPARGDSTRTYDGRTGWIATPLAVLRVYELNGGERDGARLDAQLSFPGQIKQVLRNLRVGLPNTIDDRIVDVLQGDGPGGVIATLYFDRQSGLLVRTVRFSPSPIGRVPTQVDYSDYRDVGGIRMPFRFIFSWLDGRDTFELSNIQLNAQIDPAKFGKPNPLGPR